MTNTKTVLKLGDKVRAMYRGAEAVGIIDSFIGGWIGLKLTQPCDLGFRVETESVGLGPEDRHSVTLIEAGPALAAGELVALPAAAGGGGAALTDAAIAARARVAA